MQQMFPHRLDPLHVICDRIAEDVVGQAAVFTGDEIMRWPAGWIDAAVTSRLLEKVKRADRVECRGCSRRCSRSVEKATGVDGLPTRFFLTCELRGDISCIPVAPRRLERWRMTRQQLVGFIARELNLPVPVFAEAVGIIRLGTFKGHSVRCAIAIEFSEKVSLLAGDARIDPSELMKWNRSCICLDREELEIRAGASSERQTGGKRYQASKVKQQLSAQLRILRDQRLQEMADQLKTANPIWKKSSIAAAIFESGEFPGIKQRTTIERIIIVPRKMRRKNFA